MNKYDKRGKEIIKLTVLYAIVSGLWIVLSDKLLGMLVGGNFEKLEVFSIAKGLFFVSTTSLLLFYFCKKWSSYLKDIEEDLVKRKETEINDETKYKRVFDVANDALFIVDKKSLRFLSVNASACKMYGYSQEEFINDLNIFDLSAQYEISKSVLENELIRIEHGIHKKSDGTVFHVDITITYFTINDIRILAASVRDMTEHYMLVHDLKSNEQKYIEAQLLGNVGNWNWNIRTNKVSWSPGMFKIHGIEQNKLPQTEEEFFGQVHPDDKEMVIQQIKNLRETLEPALWESRIIQPDGNIRYLQSKCVVNVDKKGVPIELVGTQTDITERKYAENELRKFNEELEQRVALRTEELILSNQEKDEILGIAAHDLRNPLGGILLLSGLIKMYLEKGRSDEAKIRIVEIEKSVGRMNEIITNLLNTNALELGKYTFNVISFDCEKTIENVKDSIMLHAESKNITIHWKKNDETIVYADENAFKEVIENLLSNAIKYSPSGSNIWITITTEKDFVTIRIKDEGPGFSDDDKLKLFKKFSRLSARPTAGESSIGLGLSIVKKLVSAMNGRITVESIHGEGAEFIVEFPKSDLSIHK